MAKKNLTTEEILAAARAEVAKTQGGSAPAEEPAEADAAEEAPAAAQEVADAQETPKPADVPKQPTSTADILAAARAEAGGGAEKATAQPAAETAEKPAEAPKQPAKKPTSTADILAAARAEAGGGAKEEAKEAPAKTAAETVEKKPAEAPKKPAKAEPTSRRNFMVALAVGWFALAWAALSATAGISLLALARFMFPNVLVEPPTKFKIGPPSDYPLGTVSTKWKPSRGVWIVHTDSYQGQDLISALISTCTHLGCTPNWLEGEQKFKCPCHGSGFYISGINFEGPAPRPLERCGIRLAPDGMLEVDKSVKFQDEMGQWEDGASFVEVA